MGKLNNFFRNTSDKLYEQDIKLNSKELYYLGFKYFLNGLALTFFFSLINVMPAIIMGIGVILIGFILMTAAIKSN